MKKIVFLICTVLALAVFGVGCAMAYTESPSALENLSGIYEETDMAHIYRLNQSALDGYRVTSADMHGGYILLTMHGIAPNQASTDRLVLFPISDPDTLTCMEAAPDSTYYLLDGGSILERRDANSFVLYNAGFEQLYCDQAEGSFLGASADGSLWFMTDDGQLSQHRDGKQASTIEIFSLLYGNYLGSSEGKAYFDVISDERGQLYLSIDTQSLQCDEITMLHDVFDASNGAVCYSSNDWWMTASMEDPFAVTAFTKPYAEDGMWNMDDRYLISHAFQYDESLRTGYYVYRVFDMRTGNLLDERSSLDMAAHTPTMMVYDQGLILYADVDDDDEQTPAALYLWDVRGLSAAKPAGFYKQLDFHVDQERIDTLIGEIYVMYDVNIYYDEAHLAGGSADYALNACTDMNQLGYALVMLKACMAEYPRGFFDDIKASRFDRVVYCMCDGHLPLSENVISVASALTWERDTSLFMSYDVNYWWDMRSTFLHENTHMMERRLQEETDRIGYAYLNQYWYDRLNSPECPSMQNYVWEHTDENLKGVYDQDGENAWYIDAYSKSTTGEDRARIMERGLYSTNAKYYQSPHIDRKSRFLNALIREVFPSVHNSAREVFWETRTGIVDLYEEFPDFAEIE